MEWNGTEWNRTEQNTCPSWYKNLILALRNTFSSSTLSDGFDGDIFSMELSYQLYS